MEAADDLDALEEVRVRFMGRKAALALLLRSIPELSPEERKVVGRFGNLVKRELETAFASRHEALQAQELVHGLEKDRVDVTLPGRVLPRGHLHLITQTQREIEDIFIGLGYEVAEGPEAETDYYNFEALNHPPDHPARSLHDTFFITDEVLLRTHTSPVQVRVMERQRPPVWIIAPGKAFRRDSDATHTPMFHQVEGLVVDEGITAADLKGTLEAFAKAMFGADRKVRLRPHYFPFTEPSVEVDVSCMMCEGVGCRSGHGRPQRLRVCRLRSGAVYGFRLRYGHRAHRHAQARYQRPTPLLRQRPALPAPVLGGLQHEGSAVLAS